MKKNLLVLTVVFAIKFFCVVAQEKLDSERVIIIDGKFFRNLPEGIAKSIAPNGITRWRN